MNSYKLFRVTHKWFGIIFAVVLLNVSVTGILLLEKKNFDWLQPPTQKGQTGNVEDFITQQQLFKAVFEQGHVDFKGIDDIDRVDFRPGKRVHKVQSIHNNSEIQVDAVSGKVLSVSVRRSDLIESLHDGSWFGNWVNAILLPATAIVCIFLTVTGLLLWLIPTRKKIAARGNSS
ncbi:MAG: PepSY domain-containing protein [Anaerohalosphaera sp.]|nr:PepSY domain-containing protein [Anaerohalosphaera sp.]